MSIKVLLVDDHEIIRESIGFLLRNETGIEVVGEAEDGRIAVDLARELHPDIILMDITMPRLNGIEATRQIVKEFPRIKVIALSVHSDRLSVREMLKAGAKGYVLKNSSFHELVSAIKNVTVNQTYISPRVSRIVVDGYLNRLSGNENSAYSELTSREREVLQLIAEGKSTKTIARELYLSTKTIEWHRSQIMKKLGIESIANLVKYAISEGLTSAYV